MAINRYGQLRSGPDRYRPGPTDLRPSRIEPILLVRSGPSVSPGPIGSVHLNCLDRSVRSKCKLRPKTDRSGPICKSSGLEMNRANLAEGLLGLGPGARTEPSTEQLEMQLTNA